jgi:hypothetical protein
LRIPAVVHNYRIASKFPATRSLVTAALIKSQSITGPTPSWTARPCSNTLPFLPPYLSACDRSLPLCSSFHPTAPKRDLRTVQFR